MQFHPICATFDPLLPQQRAKLKASIKKLQCRMPVVLWKNPNDGSVWCIDGKHRVELCGELGQTFPTVHFVGTETEAIAMAESLNDDRRHQTDAEKQARVERVAARRRNGESLRVIAKAEKISESQVRNDLELVGAQGGCAPAPKNGTVVGTNGVHQKAKKAPKKVHIPPDAGESWEPPTEAEETAQKAAEEARDAKGYTLPKKLRDTFGDPFLSDCVERLESWVKHLKNNQTLYPWALLSEIVPALETAARHLGLCKPFCVHRKCEGKGCGECRNCGFVPQWRDVELEAMP
jgi:hypothetical protein